MFVTIGYAVNNRHETEHLFLVTFVTTNLIRWTIKFGYILYPFSEYYSQRISFTLQLKWLQTQQKINYIKKKKELLIRVGESAETPLTSWTRSARTQVVFFSIDCFLPLLFFCLVVRSVVDVDCNRFDLIMCRQFCLSVWLASWLVDCPAYMHIARCTQTMGTSAERTDIGFNDDNEWQLHRYRCLLQAIEHIICGRSCLYKWV